jgi:hypothetical protein
LVPVSPNTQREKYTFVQSLVVGLMHDRYVNCQVAYRARCVVKCA